MNKLVLVTTCSMLALPASAATVGEKTGVNSALGLAPTTKDFVDEAVWSAGAMCPTCSALWSSFFSIA